MNYKIALFLLLSVGSLQAMKFVEPSSFSFSYYINGTIKVQESFRTFDELLGHVNNNNQYNCFLSTENRSDGIDMSVYASTNKVYWNLFKRFYKTGHEHTCIYVLRRMKKDGYFIANENDSNYATCNVKMSYTNLGQHVM